MTASKTMSKVIAIAMVIAMALTMTVSAFASEIQPYNADATQITASVSYASQTYSVTVQAPAGTTKINASATLYQKTLFGYKEIDSMTANVSSWKCVKSQSATIEKGKTYKIEVTAEIYSGGQWDTITAEKIVNT